MSYRHGIYGMEVPTKVVPPILSEVGLPVVVGTAPIHLATNPAPVNTPVLIYSYEEAVEKFGYSEDWGKYTLSEFIYSQFVLYGRAPVVLINVLDPTVNASTTKTETVTLVNGKAVLAAADIIADTIVVTKTEDTSTLTLGINYLVSRDSDNKVIITAVDPSNDSIAISVSFKEIDTTGITKTEIIGGVDVSTGKKTGLELISEVYPRFRIVPGTVLAPGYSSDSEVAAILATKAININGLFRAVALIDAPSNLNYSDVPSWKNTNNVVENDQFIYWPKVKLGEKIYHMSTHMAGVIQATDSAYGGIPYKSPSNESMKIDATVNDNGEIYLGTEQANYLNGQGINTAINFAGWKSWGNRTAAYPLTSDVKDAFIPIRRMFDWTLNSLILTYWSKIDNPLNKRLIETVVDSANLWLNGLTAQGALYGGRVQFLSTENPVTNLMDGKLKFHFYLSPPAPAEDIEFVQEYDVNYAQEFIRQMAE